MVVYDMKADGRSNEWVLFSTRNGLLFPNQTSEEEAFFDQHPKIAVGRDKAYTPNGSKAKLADFSSVNYDVYPVFSDRARTIVAPILEGLGRWIELDFDEAPYWLFYITNVVDALDEGRSQITRFSSSQKVLSIDSYAFKPEVAKDQWLFTLPQRPGSNRLVTDRFVELVREHRLTGFLFQKLWSSDEGPVPAGIKDWLKPRITGLEGL